ncbi:hypothetical protein E2320_007233 [Naja naja]|nr:hypothetical protein E2320_007233 [Naja naja]
MRGVGGSARGWLRLCGGGVPGRGGRRAMAEAAGLMGQRIVWVDLEMTGLDVEKDQILEMACLVTDSGLNILAEHVRLVQRASWEGNSVHADKKFLDKYMPQFMKHLHYRIIDVSTVKELCRRWYPEDYEFAPKKSASHRNNIFKRKTDEKKRKLLENGESEQSVS